MMEMPVGQADVGVLLVVALLASAFLTNRSLTRGCSTPCTPRRMLKKNKDTGSEEIDAMETETSEGLDKAPVIVFHHFGSKSFHDKILLFETVSVRLETLLQFAVKDCSQRVRLIHFLPEDAGASVLHEMIHEMGHDYSATFKEAKSYKEVAKLVGSSRVCVCSGNFDKALYTIHELKANGADVGVLLSLSLSCMRSGSFNRADLLSHVEEILEAKILSTTKAAVKWLLPDGPSLSAAAEKRCEETHLKIKIVPEGVVVKPELKEDHRLLISTIFKENVCKVELKKIGKGFSKAHKFFCTPTIKTNEGAKAKGAMIFLKMGDEEEVAKELDVTRQMMMTLGNNCPQVINYAEAGETGGMLLTLANMGDDGPKGFATLYSDLLDAAGEGKAKKQKQLSERLESAVEYVFGTLCVRLHRAKARSEAFSAASCLGLCYDYDGKDPTEMKENRLSSFWVLQKVWRKWGGTGKLASSVQNKMREVLGEDEANHPTVNFGGGLELPNIVPALLQDNEKLRALAEKTAKYSQCLVHGDLHGDNIMIDSKDNRYLIDFGRTGIGHAFEDLTWLESFCAMEYCDWNEVELADALKIVPSLAAAFTIDTCQAKALDDALTASLTEPRVIAMWSIVRALRVKLGDFLPDFADEKAVKVVEENADMARLLCLRNALFLGCAPSTKPAIKKFAFALACAYGKEVVTMLS